MDKVTVRAPRVEDLGETLKDLVTVRTAPPLVLSAALVVVLTGNLLVSALSVLLTSFVHAFWARLVSRGES